MYFKKIVIGFLFILVVGSVLIILPGSPIKQTLEGKIENLIFHSIFDNNNVNLIMRNGEIISPGPLLKEGNGFTQGLLTREGIIEETNLHREKEGIPTLSENENLNRVAQIKLDDMFDEQYFAHISPSGEGVSDISKEVGYDYIRIGDNLAKGNYRDDEEVVQDWMDSEGHRRNIMEERYNEIGVATKKDFHEEREVWIAVQVFGMHSSVCPEIEESLFLKIEDMTEEVGSIKEKLDILKEEIDTMEEKRTEEYIDKLERYNEYVKEYNALVGELDSSIDEYNYQVELREKCVSM